MESYLLHCQKKGDEIFAYVLPGYDSQNSSLDAAV
jgi:hypothetical protein